MSPLFFIIRKESCKEEDQKGGTEEGRAPSTGGGAGGPRINCEEEENPCRQGKTRTGGTGQEGFREVSN